MKGAVISIITILALTLSVIVTASMINASASDIEEQLNNVDPEALDWAEIKETVSYTKEMFGEKRWLYTLLLKDKEMSEIESYLDELTAAAEMEAEEELMITKSRLITSLGQIRQLSGLSLKTVF